MMRKRYSAILIIWVGMSFSPAVADEAAEKAASAAAPAWLSQIDAGKYASSWKDASAYFRGAVTEKSWTDALNGFRKPLGKLVSRKLVKTQSANSLPGAPDGNYVVMQFDTSFSNKKGAVETVTFVQEKGGQWKAAGYYIK
jgi:hypothetical protein